MLELKAGRDEHRWGLHRHPGSVVASDVKMNRELLEGGPLVYCDVQDKDNLARIVLENGVNTIIHLATLLSGQGRQPCLVLAHRGSCCWAIATNATILLSKLSQTA